MDEIRMEDLPTVLEKRTLDEHAEAWLLENGSVVIVNAVGGIETLLTPERAYNLLNLLSKYGTRFLHILRPRSMTLNWKKFTASLRVCLQKAADLYQEREDEPGVTWHAQLNRALSTLAPGTYTAQELLTAIAETPDTVYFGNATLFYDDAFHGQSYQDKLVFASLYLESELTDQPICVFYREEIQTAH